MDETGGVQPRKKGRVSTTPSEEVVAKKLVAQVQSLMLQGNTIMKCIETSAAWKWAQAEEQSGPLRDALKDLENNMTTFALRLTSDIKILKTEMSDKDFVEKCKEVTEALTTPRDTFIGAKRKLDAKYNIECKFT